MNEESKKYKTIGEVAKILNLVDKKTGKLSTHTLRFWEKEFKEVKPHIFAGNRRYYDDGWTSAKVGGPKDGHQWRPDSTSSSPDSPV